MDGAYEEPNNMPTPPGNLPHASYSEITINDATNEGATNEIDVQGERPHLQQVASEPSEALMAWGDPGHQEEEYQPTYGDDPSPPGTGLPRPVPAAQKVESRLPPRSSSEHVVDPPERYEEPAPPLADIALQDPPAAPRDPPPIQAASAGPPPLPGKPQQPPESKPNFSASQNLPPAPAPTQKSAAAESTNAGPPPLPSQQQKQEQTPFAIPVKSAAQDEEQTVVQKCVSMVENTCMIIPIGWLAIGGGFFLMLTVFLDFILISSVTFLDVIVNFYLFVAAFVLICVEAPRIRFIERVQSSVFKWMKFMERLWGRAMFYATLGLLSLADTDSWIKIICGLYELFLAICMIYVSRSARNKLLRIDVYISQGQEDQKRLDNIAAKFDELNRNANGLGIEQIHQVANEAGRVLAKSEANAILQFFDELKELCIEKEDWLRGFETIHEGIRFI